MNQALRRVAGVRRTRLQACSSFRCRTYAISAAASEENMRKLASAVGSDPRDLALDTTLDEEFAARQEELVPSRPIEADERDPQIGDYPVIQISNQQLTPRGWWDQQARRNFGDPIPEYDEVLSMWGPDVPPVPPHIALYQFSLVAFGFIGFGFFCKYALVPDKPAVPREYPFSGLITELGGLEENKAREEDIADEDE
ncbi:hypothetical protein PILCRDRAFT_829284 [Piloderma croceum F 1598]|uniref:Uncharacterized protein n=1 Tax=Piloderma croceum (strain F 1598) TaxID=765440 RepID=A0A0C3EZA4_PILCF|nr:hypothetical protein PILCRDRAFT_829284 [Piloderma croceum F 1598]